MKTGQVLFDVEIPGSSRELIALFSEATEDPNPIHVDDDFAHDCGFPQVIQQGPMTTAHFGRLLAEAVGAGQVKMLDVSFSAPVFPLEALRLNAVVGEVRDGRAQVVLQAQKADGVVTAKGTAEVVAEAA
ncbi:MaoC family dehydratase [Lacisediminimonas profundi]|uniref:MaoC family dehydratase n=1 Tax=Lacisediminimonas profundi TaxID=2603856 RepID=UPI00124AE84F|nr:MaoC family dehydratase [Lacisediminimonas profundi]